MVPLDGSALAEAILPFILQIAGPLDMEVLLVRVVTPVPPSVIEGTRHVEIEDVEARLAEARAYLAPLAAELGARGVKASVMVRHGEPAAEILAGAQEATADLIAMTTHGRSGLPRLLFGSVAEAMLRESGTPVFLMKPTSEQVQARLARVALR